MSHRKRCNTVAAIALVALAGLPYAAGAASSQAIDAARQILDAAYPDGRPGAAVLVMENGEVLLEEGYGSANLEWDIPITADTVFRIGSITKQFTAAAIMLLEEEGKLSVGDSIASYLPDYPTQGHAITIEHLLTHTSGIMSYTNIPGYMEGGDIRRDLDTDELVGVFARQPMEFAPGTQWKYNNSGYVLLGAIIEQVSGQAYADFVRERITEPLGLRHTHYEDQGLVPRRAAGYAADGDGAFVNADYLSMTQPHAAGSLISTVGDLARWNEALVSGRLISAASYARMTTGVTLADGTVYPYGFGLGLGELRGRPVVAHSGGINGFQAYALWHPDKRVFVAVLGNASGYRPDPSTVGRKLAAAIVGDPYPERRPVTLSGTEMSRYTGSYAGEDAPPVTLAIVDGELMLDYGGYATFYLEAENERTLYVPDTLLTIDVEWDGDRVAALALNMTEGQPPTVVRRVAGER